jgi:hypothetical protein
MEVLENDQKRIFPEENQVAKCEFTRMMGLSLELQSGEVRGENLKRGS